MHCVLDALQMSPPAAWTLSQPMRCVDVARLLPTQWIASRNTERITGTLSNEHQLLPSVCRS